MTIDQILLFAALCVLLASAETLHGICRMAVLVPRVGKRIAVRISLVTGSLLAFAVCYYMVPRFGLQAPEALLVLGLGLALWMALFDMFIGRVIMHFKWRKIMQEFNPLAGNFLIVALILLISYPALVMAIRR